MLISSARGQASSAKVRSVDPPTALPSNVVGSLEEFQDVTFAKYGDRELQLDLYRPKVRAMPLPAIVCIHGGGWVKGDRGSMTNLAQALAARGYVTATISYRLSGEAKFPAAIQDCKAAVRWLRANADRYGIDPDHVGATGLSAGGHLAALLATSGAASGLEGAGGNVEQSSAVQACVAMGAQSDLETKRIGELSAKADDPYYRKFLGGPQSELPQLYAAASPRHHLDKQDPPLMFMTGALDDESTHADATREDLAKLGIPTELVLIPDAPHSFLGKARHFQIAVDACDRFFRKHLK
ncbi:MAG: alpha/beta hydrolase [Pirellula sp.]|nr:alpha/beta hydrolase [Pirellula sp.]